MGECDPFACQQRTINFLHHLLRKRNEFCNTCPRTRPWMCRMQEDLVGQDILHSFLVHQFCWGLLVECCWTLLDDTGAVGMGIESHTDKNFHEISIYILTVHAESTHACSQAYIFTESFAQKILTDLYTMFECQVGPYHWNSLNEASLGQGGAAAATG